MNPDERVGPGRYGWDWIPWPYRWAVWLLLAITVAVNAAEVIG